jgi:hypothetical protein
MPILPFSEWTPDAADLGSIGAITVTNALPNRDGYSPAKSLTKVTSALASRPLGAIEAYDSLNTPRQYAGDAVALYQLDANLDWEDVSQAPYVTDDGEIWEFVRWENKILATNYSDYPQQITMGAANFSDLTADFKARRIAVVRDFVVAGNTWDSVDDERPNRVRWSAIGNETDWTVSASTLSDFRDLATGGPIQKILGGEVGIIISQRSTFRMSFVGAPGVFQIDEILPNIGTISGNTATRFGDSVYFVSDQGFVELLGNGTGINRIGAGKVDQFFLSDLDQDYYHRISCISDPTANRIYWAYPGAGNVAGRPNKIIVYDLTFAKWSLIEQECELLLRAKGFGVTLEELPDLGYTDLDTMDVSLDSPTFKSSANQMAAFDADFEMGFFRGLNKTATLTTKEVEIYPGFNTHLNAFRPLVDLGIVTARVGYRRRLSDPVQWSAPMTQSASGRFTQRNNARFHRIELTVSGDNWVQALGVIVDPSDARRSEIRA